MSRKGRRSGRRPKDAGLRLPPDGADAGVEHLAGPTPPGEPGAPLPGNGTGDLVPAARRDDLLFRDLAGDAAPGDGPQARAGDEAGTEREPAAAPGATRAGGEPEPAGGRTAGSAPGGGGGSRAKAAADRKPAAQRETLPWPPTDPGPEGKQAAGAGAEAEQTGRGTRQAERPPEFRSLFIGEPPGTAPSGLLDDHVDDEQVVPAGGPPEEAPPESPEAAIAGAVAGADAGDERQEAGAAARVSEASASGEAAGSAPPESPAPAAVAATETHERPRSDAEPDPAAEPSDTQPAEVSVAAEPAEVEPPAAERPAEVSVAAELAEQEVSRAAEPAEVEASAASELAEAESVGVEPAEVEVSAVPEPAEVESAGVEPVEAGSPGVELVVESPAPDPSQVPDAPEAGTPAAATVDSDGPAPPPGPAPDAAAPEREEPQVPGGAAPAPAVPDAAAPTAASDTAAPGAVEPAPAPAPARAGEGAGAAPGRDGGPPDRDAAAPPRRAAGDPRRSVSVSGALRVMPIPDHDDEFWDELAVELADEPQLRLRPRAAVRPITQPPPVIDDRLPFEHVEPGRRRHWSRRRVVVWLVALVLTGLLVAAALQDAGERPENVRSGDTSPSTAPATTAPAAGQPLPSGLPGQPGPGQPGGPPSPVDPSAGLAPSGVGPLTIGSTLGELQAAGIPVVADPPTFTGSGGTCYDARVAGVDDLVLKFRSPDPVEGVSDPVEGILASITVDAQLGSPRATEAGIALGATEDQVRSAYGDDLEERDHDFLAGGHILIWEPPDAGRNAIAFMTDGFTVVSIVVGDERLVGYPEGCG